MKQSNFFNLEYIKYTKIPFKNEEEISFSRQLKSRTTLSEKLKKIVQGEEYDTVKKLTHRDEEHLKWEIN